MRIILIIVAILTASVYAANYDAEQYAQCSGDFDCEVRDGAENGSTNYLN